MSTRGPFTIYYDAGCPFCIRMVRIFRAVLGLRGTMLLAAQDDPQRHLEMREKDSWIVVTPDGQHLHGWKAVATVVEDSRVFRPLGKLIGQPLVLPAGERLYRWIERHRPLLSRLTDFLNADPPKNS